MVTFLVEVYEPRGCDPVSLSELEARTRAAANQVSRSGGTVQCLRAILVPEDETCFYVFEASSRDSVLEAARRAGLSNARVTETIESPAHGSCGRGR